MKSVLLLVLLSFGAVAQQVGYHDYVDYSLVIPAEGMWFEADEPGRGLTLEIQDERLLITYFGYRQDGAAQWWQGVGYQEGDSNVYKGAFDALAGGQCVGCSYQFPVLDTDNSIGDFTITFSDGNNALFEWAGKDMDLVKYYYGYSDTLDRAKGIWELRAEGDNGRNQVKEFLLFDKITAGPDKIDVLTGYETGSVGFAAATTYTPQSGNGKEVVIFAYALPNGRNSVYAVYLDHVTGKSDLDNLTETGLFDFDSETQQEALPVRATKIMALAESQPYIDFYNDYLAAATSGKSGEKVDVKFSSGTFVSPHSRLKAKMDVLESVIQDMYDNLNN